MDFWQAERARFRSHAASFEVFFLSLVAHSWSIPP